MRSKLQKASSQRAWRILQLRGVLAFLDQMQLPKELVDSVNEKARERIEKLWAKEKA